MIEYNNKGISIARGDTGAILIELFNKDGTPFSLPVGMVHPYIVFSMASLLSRMQLSDELYIEKYYAVTDYKLYGAVDGAGITGGFDRNVVTTWPAGDTLLPGKIYKNSTDNKYYFLDNSVSPSTVREYHFIVSLSFDGEDTRNIMPGIYKYSVNVIDSAFDIDMVNNEPDFAAFFAGMTQKDDIFGSQQFMITDSQFVRGASTHIVQVLEMNPLSSAAQVAYRTLEIISRDSNGQLVLPIATATKLGAIRVGETLTISAFGILNVSNEIVTLPDRVTLLEQGAVDLDRRLDYLEPVVEQLGVDMTAAQTDIADIQERMVNPETNIGSLTGEQFPADVTLDAFVLATAGRPVRNNDTIYFTLVTPAEDEYYKYVYSLTGWTRGKMPSQEPAKNGTKGIVQGTYAIDRTYNILVSIIDGEVRAIYFKNTTTNTYQQVDITLNTLLTRIDGIITGATMVGKAARANADGDGNIFSQVYAKIVNYYSKAESDDRYVSQSYITPYYYNINGTITDAPSSDRSAKYTATVTAGNYAELATFERIIIGDLAFSAKDKYSANVWLSTSADIANLQVRLTTYLKHPDDTSYTLANTEVTGGLAFASGVLTKVQFSDNYRELESIFDSEPGDTFKQVISLFYTRSSGEAEGTRVVQMYSDKVYPSVFQFDIFYSPSKSPEVPSFTKVFSVTDWSALQADGCYHITILEHQHGQGANKSPLVDLKTLDANGNYVALPSLYDISNDGTIDIFTDELFAGFVVIRSGTSAFLNTLTVEIEQVNGLQDALDEKILASGGEVGDAIATFDDVSGTASNISSGGTIKSLFGKIKNWLGRLKTLAFKDTIADADVAADAAIAQSKINGLSTDLLAKAAASDLTIHTGNTSNPHGVTKAQVGLGSVDNTADTAKPVSTPQLTALNAKVTAAGGEVGACISAITEDTAATRTNLSDGDTIKVQLGKIKRWFSALGSLAFKSSIANGDINNQAILTAHFASTAVCPKAASTDFTNGSWTKSKTLPTANDNGCVFLLVIDDGDSSLDSGIICFGFPDAGVWWQGECTARIGKYKVIVATNGSITIKNSTDTNVTANLGVFWKLIR